MDSGFPRLIRTHFSFYSWTSLFTLHLICFEATHGGNALFLYYAPLTGSIFLFSGAKSYQYDIRQNRVVNVISANSWQGCWYSRVVGKLLRVHLSFSEEKLWSGRWWGRRKMRYCNISLFFHCTLFSFWVHVNYVQNITLLNTNLTF